MEHISTLGGNGNLRFCCWFTVPRLIRSVNYEDAGNVRYNFTTLRIKYNVASFRCHKHRAEDSRGSDDSTNRRLPEQRNGNVGVFAASLTNGEPAKIACRRLAGVTVSRRGH